MLNREIETLSLARPSIMCTEFCFQIMTLQICYMSKLEQSSAALAPGLQSVMLMKRPVITDIKGFV